MATTRDVTIQRTTAADIPSVITLLRPSIVSPIVLQDLVRDGKSVVARTGSGEIVAHIALSETREEGFMDWLYVSKPGSGVTRAELNMEVRRLQSPESGFQEYAVIEGSCDK